MIEKDQVLSKSDSAHSDPYVVIFTSQRTEENSAYDETAERMIQLARKEDGFVEFKSVRNAQGNGISISIWKDKKSIDAWKNNFEHQEAQKIGKEKWYSEYSVYIARIEKFYTYQSK